MTFKSIFLISFLIILISAKSSTKTCEELEASKETCTSYNLTEEEKKEG